MDSFITSDYSAPSEQAVALEPPPSPVVTPLTGKQSRRLRKEYKINLFDPKQSYTDETFAAIIKVHEEGLNQQPGSVEDLLDLPLSELTERATRIIKASTPPTPDEGKR